jgi:hypothetical protein
VSLDQFRERIESGEADAALREHLRGCDECRTHYDRVTRLARALGDEGAASESARLVAALPHPARTPWLPAGAAIVALAAGLVLMVVRPQPQPEVGLRGVTGNPTAPPPFSLRVYAKDAPGLPVHLVADFPGSGEATVGVRAEVQFFVKPPPPPGLALVVETTSGQRSLIGRAEGAGGADFTPVGAAFPAGSLGPGDARVCAVLAATAHDGQDPATIESLKRGGYTASQVYCSTLRVTP